MERIIYPCTCRKCHKTSFNNSDSLLPEIIYGYDDMTSINFNIICPTCFTKNYIDNDSIPNSVKIERILPYFILFCKSAPCGRLVGARAGFARF